RARVNELARREVVHPILVGGNEDIRLCALFDLVGERGTGGEVEDRPLTPACGVKIANSIERVCQARSGIHAKGNGLRPCRWCRRKNQRGGGQDSRQDRSSATTHQPLLIRQTLS